MKNLNLELEKFKGKTLMVVFPHPDDESMMTGGLLTIAVKSGLKTVVVTLTKGGAGKLYINPRGKSTKEVRSQELNGACKALVVNKFYGGDFGDGELKNQTGKWKPWLLGIIKKEKPKIMVTYDHSGLTGHPDHIVLSKAIMSMYEGQALLHRPQLYWVSLNEKLTNWFVPKDVRQYFQKPTHILDLGFDWITKWRAVKCHKSQRYAQIKITFPLFLYLALNHFEWYHKVDLNKTYKAKYMEFKI